MVAVVDVHDGEPAAAQVVLLARVLQLPVERVVATVRAYNAAVQPGTFDHTILDDCRTEGLEPPKFQRSA